MDRHPRGCRPSWPTSPAASASRWRRWAGRRRGAPFRPHLTIARTDAAHGTDGVTVADALADAARAWSVSFEASTVTLYQSHLGSGPARYEAIAEVPLAG